MKKINEDSVIIRFLDINGNPRDKDLRSVLEFGYPVDEETWEEMLFEGVYLKQDSEVPKDRTDGGCTPIVPDDSPGLGLAVNKGVKEISLEDAFRVLEDCSAVFLPENGELCYPSLSDLTGEEGNEFLFLELGDGILVARNNGRFTEGDNATVKINKNMMTMINTGGDKVSFYVLSSGSIEDMLCEH